VSASNLGTAVSSWVAGLTLGTSLGVTGPVVLGTIVMAFTLVPVVLLTVLSRRETQPH
jgi:predicted MFS family arabinose efflux permease